MNFYHFTTPENALMIALGGEGLEPSIQDKDNGFQRLQQMGQPVVWLTKEETNIADADDVAFYQQHGVVQKIGEPRYGGTVCCTVEVERNRHLMRWVDFLRTTKLVLVNPDNPAQQITGRDVLQMYEHGGRLIAPWWISFKPIPLSKIWVPMTRDQIVEGCQWHVDKSDCEGWQQTRDQFAAEAPNALFMFHDGKCHQAELEQAAGANK